MRASLLSLALSALLITAAPTSDAQSENPSLGRLQKRKFTAVYTNTFNGKAVTPGTQVQPGVWVGSETIHICNMSCLDPNKSETVRTQCIYENCEAVGCRASACTATSCINVINKSYIYVVDNDATAGYWGNELGDCPAPAAPRTVCHFPPGSKTPTNVLTTFYT